MTRRRFASISTVRTARAPSVPNTGNWHDWTTVTAATGVDCDADSTIRVVAEINSWNVDELHLE